MVAITDRKRSLEAEGLHEQTNFLPILNETCDLLTYWWDECAEIRNRAKWPFYSCLTSVFMRSRDFVPSSDSKKHDKNVEPLKDLYITLWSHQLQPWFRDEYADNSDVDESKLLVSLQDAKDSGFTSVMGDLP
jgi:hypothetical protein